MPPPEIPMEATIVLVLLAVVGTLFCFERVPVDVVALGVVVALLAARILTPAEALAGFGNEAVIVIGGLFVLTAGLKSSGALESLANRVRLLGGGKPRLAVSLLLLLVAMASAFMNNTTCTAVFLPVAMALARAEKLPPSQLLMPVAFASILGGTLTLIGTSTNVIVSGLLPSYGLAPLGMFELTPVGLPVAVLGLLFLIFLAHRILPAHHEVALEQQYHIRDYLTEVVVQPRSPLVGKSVAEAGFGRRWDLNLLGIHRQGRELPFNTAVVLAAGDVLVVEGKLDTLLSLGSSAGLLIRRGPDEASGPELAAGTGKLVEALVMPTSDLVGRTLKEVGFRQRYGASVVALNRHSEPVLEKLGRISMAVGDVLLIYGEETVLGRLLGQSGLLVLSDRHRVAHPRARAAVIAPLALGLFVVLSTTGWVSLSGAVLLSCLLLFVSRCLTPQEAYDAVDWRLLVLVAGMMAMGTALSKSGAAALLAEGVMEPLGGLGPLAVLAGFYLLTTVLTQPMSNQAAALVVLPVAMGVANSAGIDPRAMAITVALAASSSFLTPLEPSCLLVYGPGRYRFLDFPKLGLGITAMAMLLTLLLVPFFWPL